MFEPVMLDITVIEENRRQAAPWFSGLTCALTSPHGEFDYTSGIMRFSAFDRCRGRGGFLHVEA